jgi:hypothetical protein
MAKFVGLGTATLLSLLAAQAEPVTATMGFIWAGVHIVAILRNWNDSEA